MRKCLCFIIIKIQLDNIFIPENQREYDAQLMNEILISTLFSNIEIKHIDLC